MTNKMYEAREIKLDQIKDVFEVADAEKQYIKVRLGSGRSGSH